MSARRIASQEWFDAPAISPVPMTTTCPRSGDEIDDLFRPIEQRLGDDDDGRAGIDQLVLEVRTLVGGVDRDGDRAGADDPPPGQDRGSGVLDECGDAVTVAHTECGERPGDPIRCHRDLRGRQLLATDVEVLTVGIRAQPSVEQAQHGLLLPTDPDLLGHHISPAKTRPTSIV